MIMKKHLFNLFVFLVLSPLGVNAYDAYIGGIYYNLNNEEKTAEVTYGTTNYTSSVIIPQTVIYKNVNYTVKSIGKNAFQNCYSLYSVIIPSTVISIGEKAFSGSGIATINIPSGVTEIKKSTFSTCSNLLEVEIPYNVISIGDEAFNGCSNLWSVSLPMSLISIGSSAFSGCGFTTITIPNSVEEIGNSAFRYCSNLKSFTLSEGLTTIPSGMCMQCTSLDTVVIPENIKVIDRNAFLYSGVSTLILPTTLESIHYGAFSYTRLKYCYCYANKIPETEDKCIFNTQVTDGVLHVRTELLEEYKTISPWNLFMEIVPLTDNDPNPTGIKNIVNEKNKTIPYDLKGNRLEKPKKGINIVNGKKIIVK